MLRIKEVAKTKGIRLSEVAQRLGISSVAFSNSINGNPTIETLLKIANVLDCDVRELIKPTKENNLITLYFKDDTNTFQELGSFDIEKLKSMIK